MMFGLSTIKLIGIGLGVVAIIGVIFAGYRFVSNQIDDRVNGAVVATQSQDAARINAVTAAQTAAEAKANAAQEAQTMQRLNDLGHAQQQNASKAQDISGSLHHDFSASSSPDGDASAARDDFDRLNRMLECASGAAGSCVSAEAGPADAAQPGSSGAGKAPRS
jgi:hypothetical protein